MDIKVGDIVKGLPHSPYRITNENMERAQVLDVHNNEITIVIIKHNTNGSGRHKVESQYLEVIDHVKAFNRSEILDLLKDGCKRAILEFDLRGANLRGANLSGANLSDADLSGADLSDANLRDANLRYANLSGVDLSYANLRGANLSRADLSRADLSRADLDFSCLPLKCGGLRIKTGSCTRLAAQLAYHLCSMQCDDAGYIAMRNSILPFANKFHRAGECGELKPIETEITQ